MRALHAATSLSTRVQNKKEKRKKKVGGWVGLDGWRREDGVGGEGWAWGLVHLHPQGEQQAS